METKNENALYEELIADKEFCSKLEQAKTPEEIVALFAEKGLDLPLSAAQEVFEAGSGELTENDLEDIAGGGFISAGLGAVYVGSACAIYTFAKCVVRRKSAEETIKKTVNNAAKGAKVGAKLGFKLTAA